MSSEIVKYKVFINIYIPNLFPLFRMAEIQKQLLQEYIRTLEHENSSKTAEIQFLATELQKISEENINLNEELNFFSKGSPSYSSQEKVHELEIIIEEKEFQISRLIEDRQYYKQQFSHLLAQSSTKKKRNYHIEQIQELPLQEDQKTQRYNPETLGIIETYQIRIRQNQELIDSLNHKIVQKQQEIAVLLKNYNEKLKESNDYEDKIGELMVQYELMKLNFRNLQEENNNIMKQNNQLSTQMSKIRLSSQIPQKQQHKIDVKQSPLLKQLQNSLSEMSMKVMHWQLREEEWDKESLHLNSRINRLTKQLKLLKSQNSVIHQIEENDDSEKQLNYEEIQKLKQQLAKALEANNILIAQLNSKGQQKLNQEQTAENSPAKDHQYPPSFMESGIIQENRESEVLDPEKQTFSDYKMGTHLNINLHEGMNGLKLQCQAMDQHLRTVLI